MADDCRTIGNVRWPASVLTYLAPDDPAKAIERATRHVDLWRHELSTLREWLPAGMDTVIDIGCGLGGIDLSLAQAGLARNFVLIDGKGEPANKQHGYQDVTAAWADVAQAKALMETNVPDAGAIAMHGDFGFEGWPADLILSFKSCAFHYHVNVYLPFIMASLIPGARLIIDCRKGTDNADVIRASGFRELGQVEENIKRNRLVFERI